MRVTKEIATDIANQLIKDKSAELKVLYTERQILARQYFIDTLPDGILEQFKKFKNFFSTTSSIHIHGPGLGETYKSYPIGEQLPYSNGIISVTGKKAEAIVSLNNQISAKKDAINNLKNGIINALYNLRTYNNVEKEFPEAFKLLPPSKVNTGLAINIKDIRCKLNPSNC